MIPGEQGWLKLRAERDGDLIQHSGDYEYTGEHEGLHGFAPVAGGPTIYLRADEILRFGDRPRASLSERAPGFAVLGPDGEHGEVIYRRGFWIVPPADPVFVGNLPSAAVQAIEGHGLTLEAGAVERLRGLMP